MIIGNPITLSRKSGGGVSGLGRALLFLSQDGNEFTLKVNDSTKHWDGTLEWTNGTADWAVWDGTTTMNSANGLLALRGTGNSIITGNNYAYRWVLGGTSTQIACEGSVEYLRAYTGTAPAMAANCYRYMFANCASLTTAPALPSTTLDEGCYSSMFAGCTSLTIAPVLPATTLDEGCYRSMFDGCTSLTAAPALPATTLADNCYRNMFEGCESLATAPVLPATTLAGNCYNSMFKYCPSLTTAPALPATTLAGNCYNSMFNECTSLTTAPTLPATALATGCYRSMFSMCASLTTIPALPATMLTSSCYNQMFASCTSLKISTASGGEYTNAYRIPTSGTGTDATNALKDMFLDTGGTFTGTPTINTTYYTTNLPVAA